MLLFCDDKGAMTMFKKNLFLLEINTYVFTDG